MRASARLQRFVVFVCFCRTMASCTTAERSQTSATSPTGQGTLTTAVASATSRPLGGGFLSARWGTSKHRVIAYLLRPVLMESTDAVTIDLGGKARAHCFFSNDRLFEVVVDPGLTGVDDGRDRNQMLGLEYSMEALGGVERIPGVFDDVFYVPLVVLRQSDGETEITFRKVANPIRGSMEPSLFGSTARVFYRSLRESVETGARADSTSAGHGGASANLQPDMLRVDL